MNGSEAYRMLVRPKLAELLELLHLDITFERASGCYLWPRGSEEPVLDLVGGYGTLFFGHHHPELVNVAVNYLRGERPIHAQGSIKALTGELAARLSRGAYHVLFANSGTEAVEAAIKHVMLERKGPIVALEGAFHGKTLGALQLTANPAFREGFETGLEVLRVPPNDMKALREVFERHRPAALFLELIQGEGGVVPLTQEFVSLARELCTEVALVIDECQTGLGRTGKFLACEHYGVEPDLLILSKALGGGIAKISALLVRNERYRPELGLIHTSTFADDDFSSAVALKVLDLLTEETLATCRENGRWLKQELALLASEYPEVLREVRGLGLMIGIEFAPPDRGFLLRLLGSDLALVAAGYLYHRHRIRIAPTLSNPMTLRIQPPVVTPRAELGRFVAALRDVCEKVRSGDTLGLTRYFLPGCIPRSNEVREGWLAACSDRPTSAPRVGWLCHLVDADDLVSLEPGFAALSFGERDAYLRHLERRVTPVVLDSIDVTSRTGQAARFNAILLPLTACRIKELIDARETAWLRGLVEHGLDVAEHLGCQIGVLGQYTSIVMKNGLAVRPRSIGVATGNSYAVALALEAIERAVPDLRHRTVAVVGASGNIGAAVSQLLYGRCAEIMLIGRDTPSSIARMVGLGLPNAHVSTEVSDCRAADVVVVAVNAPVPALRGEHLALGALVCDLSVPAGVDAAGRPDIQVIRGGLARMPNGEDHSIVGFPIAPGLAFACMAEGIILALENICDRSFTGDITPEHVRRISTLAKKHGFALADYKRQAVLGAVHVHV
ncbi:MAG: aminotransferase class III-fold pyridoxal phosphate-dependent enzyme [candidate division NC10 bacterium]|nr:aminotransferase class III-fold pyridoxal phosphate-dependent enzyme [candidate division NC10 bacterium]